MTKKNIKIFKQFGEINKELKNKPLKKRMCDDMCDEMNKAMKIISEKFEEEKRN